MSGVWIFWDFILTVDCDDESEIMSFELIVYMVIFVVMLVIGAPTYLALLCSGLSYCLISGLINDMMIMQKMFASLDNFVLLAIPMFMMAGIIMNSGGITTRIFSFCRSICGHLPGGLAYVNVVSSFLFSGMSGSALADIGGLGQVEMKAMNDENYDDDMVNRGDCGLINYGTYRTTKYSDGDLWLGCQCFCGCAFFGRYCAWDYYGNCTLCNYFPDCQEEKNIRFINGQALKNAGICLRLLFWRY